MFILDKPRNKAYLDCLYQDIDGTKKIQIKRERPQQFKIYIAIQEK